MASCFKSYGNYFKVRKINRKVKSKYTYKNIKYDYNKMDELGIVNTNNQAINLQDWGFFL